MEKSDDWTTIRQITLFRFQIGKLRYNEGTECQKRSMTARLGEMDASLALISSLCGRSQNRRMQAQETKPFNLLKIQMDRCYSTKAGVCINRSGSTFNRRTDIAFNNLTSLL